MTPTELPATKTRARRATPAPRTSTHARPTAVVVEDDPRHAKEVQRILRMRFAGVDVHATTDPRDALRAIRRHQAQAVLSGLDVRRLRGHWFLRLAARAAPRAHRILIEPPGRLPLSRAEMKRLGLLAAFTRPLDADAVTSLVARAIHTGPLSDQGAGL